jgi:S1-C subfamily serine protease
VLDVDMVHDIAILKPAQNPLFASFKPRPLVSVTGFPEIKLMARSAAVLDPRRLNDGDPIFISGYPLGIAVLLTTSGAIASSDTIDVENGKVKDVYWADIRANHGNSGGPVFSVETNRVVGMQRAIAMANAEFSANAEFNGQPFAYGVGLDNQGNVAKDSRGNTLRPIVYNSGLTEIIPAQFIANLLKKNRVPF